LGDREPIVKPALVRTVSIFYVNHAFLEMKNGFYKQYTRGRALNDTKEKAISNMVIIMGWGILRNLRRSPRQIILHKQED
jgi:hypothetical protein